MLGVSVSFSSVQLLMMCVMKTLNDLMEMEQNVVSLFSIELCRIGLLSDKMKSS